MQKEEEEEEGRLSALPAPPLHHILSFLSLNDAVRTSVLSRRWQFLWTDLPQFDFRDHSQEIDKIFRFIERVSKTLVISNGTNLKKFGASFNYHDCFASSVDLWVQFLIKNKVNDVSLHLLSNSVFYELPLLMYFNSSLTTLSLMRCIIAPPKNMRWKSLTSLSIARMNLSQSVMEIILSGCPVLGFLKLTECWGLSLLRLNTRSVRQLVLENWHGSDPLLEIFAPNIHSLVITGYSMGGTMCYAFRLVDISTLVVANLGLNKYVRLSGRNKASSRKFMSYMKELFESLRHVEELQLGTWFFEVLSTLKLASSKHPEHSWLKVGPWKLPQYSCKTLTLNTFCQPLILCDILYMLESSPNLETLVINAPLDKAVTKSDLNCGLLHLKTVKIVIAHNEVPYLGDEPMLKLVRVLLKTASVLEEMVVNVEKSTGVSSVRNTSEYIKLAQILLSYPRSSPIAKIVLS